jgi:hypothetical protein
VSGNAEQGHTAFEEGYGKIIQGDLKAGLESLEPLSPSSLSTEERACRTSLLDRFRNGVGPKEEIAAPFAREVASIYQQYWTRCMLREVEIPQGDGELLLNLRACLNRHGKQGDRFQSLDALTEALGPMLLEDGLHSLRGRTLPFYELMLWRKETTKLYQVELPESVQQVKVVFMSGFLLKGWLGYATCGRSHTGGWAGEDALFCLEESYDLYSENFLVSYLAHEGQHFADYQTFPKLQQPELEYRAKLVQLIKAKETLQELLEQYSLQGGTDRKSPHAYANRKIAQRLSETLFGDDSGVQNHAQWSRKSPDEIHAAALRLLRESTKSLHDLGAGRAEKLF